MKKKKEILSKQKSNGVLAGVNCWAYNLNYNIYIKLNDEGLKHWRREYNRFLSKDMQRDFQHFKSKADKKGWIEMQCLEFMRIFGSTISLGRKSMFDCWVRLSKKYCTPCS